MSDNKTERMYINGEWIEGPGGQTYTAVNPATGENIKHFAKGDKSTAAMAIEAAYGAMPAWSKTPAVERGRLLREVARLMRERCDRIARVITLENGKPIKESRGEVNGAAAHFDWYAEQGQRIYGRTVPPTFANKRHIVLHQPVGVTAAITPWNFPIMLWARKLAPALAAGCTVIARPATATTLTAIEGTKCCVDAGLPKGTVNLVTGKASEVVDVFVKSDLCRKITFTGSTEIGIGLAERAAKYMKRLSLELGGQGPALVLSDADVEVAVKGVAGGKLRNNGQSCIAVNRCYVEQQIAEKFIPKLVQEVKTWKVGNGLEEDTDCGSMINEEGLNKVLEHIEDAVKKGAKLLCGGKRLMNDGLDKGYFLEPTVLTNVTDEMMCMQEETFGPLLPVMTVKDRDEAIQRANNTKYGLSAYLFTTSTKNLFEVGEALEAGTIGVNDPVPSTTIAPFGGYKMSGLGRECGVEGIEAFLETKHLSINIE